MGRRRLRPVAALDVVQRLCRALSTESAPPALRRARRPDPLAPPPPPSSFPPLQARSDFRFEVLHESKVVGSRARVGRLHTPHGCIDTPGFVPVGTNGALKAVDHTCVRVVVCKRACMRAC
jgi:hypothetical protein